MTNNTQKQNEITSKISLPLLAETATLPPAVINRLYRSDRWLGEQLAIFNRHRLRWDPVNKCFFIYNGQRWCLDEFNAANRFAQEVVDKLLQEAVILEDSKDKAAYIQHLIMRQNNTGLRSMIESGKNHRDLVVHSSDFDKDLNLLNVKNGSLDLDSLTLRPHEHRDFITNLANVDFDENADPTPWEKKIDEMTSGDKQAADFLQKVMWLSLSGNSSEEIFVVLCGKARTGKSTLLEATKSMMGSYARTAPFSTFLRSRNSNSIRDDLATLRGCRMVIASEANRDSLFDEALVKRVTGRDTISCRHLRGRYMTYTPTFTVFLATNNLPRFDIDDSGMLRRIRVVPFTNQLDANSQLKSMLTDSTKTGSQILNWILQGKKKYAIEGLGDAFSYRPDLNDEPLFDSGTRWSKQELLPLF